MIPSLSEINNKNIFLEKVAWMPAVVTESQVSWLSGPHLPPGPSFLLWGAPILGQLSLHLEFPVEVTAPRESPLSILQLHTFPGCGQGEPLIMSNFSPRKGSLSLRPRASQFCAPSEVASQAELILL